MNKINYQKELERVLSELQNLDKKPQLLLHSCCAPCSSYCLIYLREYFDITCLFYNPNITEMGEYEKRVNELKRLCDELNRDPVCVKRSEGGEAVIERESIDYLSRVGRISVIDGGYNGDSFLNNVREGELANEPERGRRCSMCFDMRLEYAARVAFEGGYDYVTTSLTISPLKNAELLNSIGLEKCSNYQGLNWLFSDFKKKNGYKMSIVLSEMYDLYRQNYCGCIFSKRDILLKGTNV